ncbi:MAG: caffeoyl-CoA O-methyltransferase, partial [Thermoleophilaceae bacterium]|nr:caffeoyl-CoA O-methyltransferase [Thermoleophilaceae bacterium]
AFVDADKVSYPAYYEELLARLRPGGLMMLDNVLQGGRVLEPAPDDESALALASLNARIATDDQVDITMLGVADGITLIRKRN